MIERTAFGRTGHASSRVIFGAAALAGMKQERADRTLELLPRYGINHIDVAASYGDAERRLAPFLARLGREREEWFLATKTGARTAAEAATELRRSLERMGVDQVDLIQLHNLTQPDQSQVAMGPGGALEALLAARAEGLVRFIGVTGHGTWAPELHLRSVEQFDCASILTPYNFAMMQNRQYAADFDSLYAHCQAHGIAIQTIKAIALRRWREQDTERRFSWYRPIREPAARKRAVDFVLSRPGLFLNTSSDATLLEAVFEAASTPIHPPTVTELQRDVDALGVEPLFVRGTHDDVFVAQA
jgi:aryl-alcohol dehydrogenase-like predicted oxidoreductase